MRERERERERGGGEPDRKIEEYDLLQVRVSKYAPFCFDCSNSNAITGCDREQKESRNGDRHNSGYCPQSYCELMMNIWNHFLPGNPAGCNGAFAIRLANYIPCFATNSTVFFFFFSRPEAVTIVDHKPLSSDMDFDSSRGGIFSVH